MPSTSSARLDSAGAVSGGVAVVSGVLGAAYLLFGSVVRWESRSSDGTVRTGTTSGIDYLFGQTGGNAPVLFFWATVLLALSMLAAYAVRTRRRRLVWGLALLAAFVSVIGIMSIGFVFFVPALALLVTGGLWTLAARRQSSADGTTPTT